MQTTGRILYTDAETLSEDDLKKVGASKYSKGESLVVTVFAFAFDDAPVRSIVNRGLDMLELPQEVVEHIEGGGLISGWNSGNFEYNLFKNHFGLKIKPDQVKDTMQRALYAGLPGALGDCGPALRLNITKDNTAHRLMLQMSRPRKHRGGKISYWHIDDPDKLARLQAYCERDVEAEREIAKYIPELPAREQKISALDRRANGRGIKLDVRLIEKMISLADVATEEIGVACSAITRGAVDSPGTQSARLVSWLKTQDIPIDSVAKASVQDGLKACRELETSEEGKKRRKESVWKAIVRRRRTRSSAALYAALGKSPYAKARQVLELRQLVAKSSVKKLIAMLRCVEEHDQCVRGVLAYYGANRTGRWAGRLIQPQNFPRPSFKTVKEAINAILIGCTKEEIEIVFPPVLEVIASCLRGCLIPRDGMRFVTPDLSQIEARVIAWISGQDDILEVFARGDDVYTFTADKLGFTGPNKRQEGKVCVERGTLVLTRRGWLPIELLKNEDLLWDGTEWVRHKGLIDNGPAEVFTASGLPLTADHAVLCGSTWKPTSEIIDEAEGCDGLLLTRALARGSENLPSQALSSVLKEAALTPFSANALAALRSTLSKNKAFQGERRPVATLARKLKAQKLASVISDTLKSVLMRSIEAGCSTAVFDIADCGPRNRFTILSKFGPLIVHNCVLGLGFGMGWRKFIATALTYGIVYEEKRAKEIVYGWREENPYIKQFWWDCDGTVKQTIRAAMQSPLGVAEGQINKHVSVLVNKARNGSLLMTLLLPSGRRLFYRDVNLEPEDKDFEIREAYCLFNEGEIDEAELGDMLEEINLRPPRESITYSGINQVTKKWGKVRTYGGKIAENIVQAVARDVICDFALEIDDERIGDLVLSVHDELIFEVPEADAKERYARVEQIMSVTPKWAPGLPVKSEGHVVERYGK